jgi:hypothetical protein
MNTIIDIIERSQMRHALQKEHELQNLDALSHRPVALVKSEGSETEGVRISTVALPGRTKWSPPHDGQDRLVVMLVPNRPTVGERLRYGRSLAMGLGSSKQQLQSGERG